MSSSIYGSENQILSKTIAMNEYDNDNSGNIDKGSSVLDDEEEGGYASGKEEFEKVSDNPVFVGPDEVNVRKVIEEGNYGGAFVDASERLLEKVETFMTSEVLAKDDDVEKVNKDVKTEEVVLVKDSELVSAEVDEANEIDLGGVAVSEGKTQIFGSVVKLGVSLDDRMVESGGEVQDGHATKVIEEVGTKRDGKDDIESLSGGDDVNKPEVAEAPVVVPKDLKEVGSSDVSLVSKGDCVVDAIKADLADPEVAIVGETEENKGNKIEGEDVPVGGEGDAVDEFIELDRYVNQLLKSIAVNVQTNGEHDSDVHVYGDGLADGVSEKTKLTASVASYQTSVDSSFRQSQRIDGQILTDSEEEKDTDDEGGEKKLIDIAKLAALLKAATVADSDGGIIPITSQDGSRLFSVKPPSGSGSSIRSLRFAPRPNYPKIFSSPILTVGGESDSNLSEEEKKKLEKLQQIRVKYLRLVRRLGLSSEESAAAQILYRLALLGGRKGTQAFSLDAAKRMALQLESEEKDGIDFSINILVLGKSGIGKSATINSIFGEEKSPINAFDSGTVSVKEISGFVDGVKVHVVDTPGLKSSVMEQAFNHRILSSVKKLIKKNPPDVVLYVDRLDAQTRDLNDVPLLKTVTSALGPSIWHSTVLTLTHAASRPPDGPSGDSLTYEQSVTQRTQVVQQSIGHAVGDLKRMSPGLMNPVSLVENHPSCRKNREGQKILPNGQRWRSQLLLLCYSIKILSEANSLSKPKDPCKLFGFRAHSPPTPPLPFMLLSMLQSRAHPKLPSEKGGYCVDSDHDLDDLYDSKQEEEDEYDQLPPFMPLEKAQLAKLNEEQRKAYFEEFEYRVKLLQKKLWKEELRRMREIKKKGKDAATDFGVVKDVVDMALPLSFDSDNPAHRYRSLKPISQFFKPTSQFLATPTLDTQGWDHDCGYDGVNLEHNLTIANLFPAAYTIQITKDKQDFSISLDSSIAAKHGENMSSMAGFDIQNMGNQLAYVIRSETKLKNSKNKAAGGISVTFLGENVVPGVKIEGQIKLGKQFVLVGGAGAIRFQHDTAYGANFELQGLELCQVQSSLFMHVAKQKGHLALWFGSVAQFSIGRNSMVTIQAGINNQHTGKVVLRTSSSDNLFLALATIIPTAISICKKLWFGTN